MLEKAARRGHASFHVPGHKQRAVWQDQMPNERFAQVLMLDLTELADTDDLHHPSGPIAEAHRLAADCFGAEETYFLVGGSTAGNLAMILGTTSPGDLLIVQRNVHRSIVHGLMLAGARAVWLPPLLEPSSGLAVIPDIRHIQMALNRYPEAKGVIVSSPNYYGIGGDLKPIAELCHLHSVPLLVDEAHGPHFGFHPLFPESALQSGADVVVQSAHKMLSAMTMGAMLHIQGQLVEREAIRQALRMVQSSSPSFPLLASLDLARQQLHAAGAQAFEPALEAVKRAREALWDTAISAIGDDHTRKKSGFTHDPLKLTLYDTTGAMSGFQLAQALAEQGCIPEMADSRHAVLAFGTGSRPEDGDRLADALRGLSMNSPAADHAPAGIPDEPFTSNTDWEVPEPVQISRKMPATERLPLEQSVGRMAGEWVVPYPPGIPELYPGEIITAQVVERLQKWRARGASIQGAEDSTLQYIRVAVNH
jgi:arginine/lysine/ornithine decarboxylase